MPDRSPTTKAAAASCSTSARRCARWTKRKSPSSSARIDSWKGVSKAETAALHALERRRDKLLADDKALTELLAEHPELDAQHLRTLIRNARKEQAENKPPKAYREIFQILKDLQASKPPADESDER